MREYQVIDRIGSGGYGEVYRAKQLSVDREVAIKVILPMYASDPTFVANFETEAKLVAQLEHPNIVPLYDYWQNENGAFLVMRYVRGGNLRALLMKQGELSLTRTLRLIEQIADALNAAHDVGVIHRDLKPDNILIDQRGSAYLTDFGIAKQTDGDHVSETDAIKGTLAYISPEQIRQTTVSPQTDIYALGVLLYEMLAGKHPFLDTPVAMMIMRHMQESLPDITDVRDDLGIAIDDIIQRATAKNPAERYASTLNLVADLRAAVDGRTPVTPQPVQITRKRSTTTEERNRYAMLQNIRKSWIEGVLENSLHHAVQIDLCLKAETGQVMAPWDTLMRTPGGDERVAHELIVDVFDRLNGKLLILGDPGSGKTTTLLTLTRYLLHRAELDDAHPIPAVLNLSSWGEKQMPLAQWIVEELNQVYQVPRKVGSDWVENDELLLLLDGLDEVAEAQRTACVEAINTYRGEHGFVDVVVCSRIADYEMLDAQLLMNGAIVIQPLNETQIVAYLNALGPDVAQMRDIIIRDAQFRELAQSPLMLSIMILAYREATAGSIPNFDAVDVQRDNLFETYLARMFERRGDPNRYTNDQTIQYLHWLASRMKFQARSVLNIEDIDPRWIRDLTDLTSYIFLARGSFVVAMAVAMGLATLIFSVGTGLVPVVPITLGGVLAGTAGGWLVSRTSPDDTNPLWNLIPGGILATSIALLLDTRETPGLFFGLVLMGFVLGFATYSILRIVYVNLGNSLIAYQRIEKVRWDVRTWWEPRLILVGVASAFIVNTLGVVINRGITPGNFITGVLVSIPVMVTIVLVMGTARSTTIEVRMVPNQGIRDSLANANRVSAIVATLWGLALLAATPTLTLRLGASLGAAAFAASLINAWLVSGGFVFIEHALVRAFFHFRYRAIPFDLADFLDYASSLILMRKVGGGYIFIHRYLLEYFAALEPDPPER